MKLIHDIRQQIPQFSANFFPPYTYQPYPRMMVNKETGKPYLDKQKKPIIVQDEHEEKLFLAQHYKPEEAPKAVDISVIAPVAPVQRAHFEAMTPAQAEKAAGANETVAPKRRGRPPSLPKNLT